MARFLLLLLATLAVAETANAQIWRRARDAARRGAERAVERQAEDRARRATDDAIDGMFDTGEDAVRCVFTDQACIDGARSRGQDVVLTDADGAPVDRSGAPVSEGNASDAVVRSGGAPRSVGTADANYNFTPGERTLLAADFSRDAISDFPRQFEFVNGNAEVVSIDGRRAVMLTNDAVFGVPLPQALPSRFTVQFEYYNPDRHIHLAVIPHTPTGDAFDESDYRYRFPHHYFVVSPESGGTGVVPGESGLPTSTTRETAFVDGFVPVEITVDEGYAKMYVNGARVANIPNASFDRGTELLVLFGGVYDGTGYIANLRVAAGGNDLYGALQSEGRVVTEGIFFDTASATLKPESFAVIQEIASMLQEHPALRVRVEGHTDAQGDAASNLSLSEARAAAVRTMLVGLGVADDRVEAAGQGQTQPVASNDTAEGRAQNRRVELVRL